MIMSNPASLPPGFRFHPTDEELILHYLRNRAASAPCPVAIIADVDIYKFDPWDLPSKAMYGDKEWYFFSPRDRKYPNGIRPNRAAASGYWKATGTDKPIHSSKSNENIGVKKALVFYTGRPPKGTKTNWIMHEYRLAEAHSSNAYKPMKFRNASMRLDDWVLCRIYKKSSQMSPMMQPLMDQEPEDARFEENIYTSAIMQPAAMFPQQSTQRLQKTLSVSDFLDDYSSLAHLFDGMPEQSTSNNTLLGHPSINQFLMNTSSSNNGNLVPHMIQMDAAVGESSRKRNSQEVNEFSLPAAKRLNASCLPTGLSMPQVNALQTATLSQQLLLSSNLGLH